MGNGLSEGYNRTLLDMLGTLHELMFGRKPRLPIGAMFDMPTIEVAGTTSQGNYAKEIRQRIRTTQEVVNKVTESARAKQKEYYYRKAKAAKINIGDAVLVKIPAFNGKHKIEERFEQDTYTVVRQSKKPMYMEGKLRKLHLETRGP